MALETAIELRFNSPELIGARPDVFDQVWRIFRREADPDFVKFFEGITGVSE